MKEEIIKSARSALEKMADKLPQQDALKGLKIAGILGAGLIMVWGILKA